VTDSNADRTVFPFEGITAVITGAASGIGAALAERLASRGARLVLADIAREPLERIADRLAATPMVVDVSKPDDVDRLAEVAPDARLVCLNAGVTSTHPGPVWETPPDEWQRVLDINLGGVVNGLRSFIPRLLDAGQPAEVLITASLAGLATWPGGGPYAASKHAVVAVAEQAALALADSPVQITVLCPALVKSGMSESGDDPHDVADAALDAMAAGHFIAVPAMWAHAIRQRGEQLATGLLPVPPEPSS
jgi:NAD(P)-dependent dehydrogenase (short-subunit alcohol dehydrogenase family)